MAACSPTNTSYAYLRDHAATSRTTLRGTPWRQSKTPTALHLRKRPKDRLQLRYVFQKLPMGSGRTNRTQTFTVEYNRDGSPGMALIVGRLRDSNRRFLANHADEETLKQLAGSAVEQIGQSGQVQTAEDGRNLFSFAVKTKL